MAVAAASRELTYERPWLYPKQESALFNDSRYAICESTTKGGKTVGALAWLTEQALIHGGPGRHYWWVAPVYPQAQIAYNRLVHGLPREVFRKNDTELKVTFLNGSIMQFKSGEKPDNLYGEDVYAAVIDEGSRLREESWHAIRTTLTATRGPVRIIGNVKGRRNWMYHLARKAEAGEQGMVYTKITWRDAVEAGVLEREEIEDAKRTLPPEVFQQLYEAEAADDEGNPFGVDAIRECMGPLSAGPPKVWGWDLAKSTDWTVGMALDATGCACRFIRYQKPWRETESDILLRTTGPALVDSTGVGDPILEQLQAKARHPQKFDGFKFSQSSKQQLMEGLAAAIQRREISGLPDVVVSELEAFEYTFTRTGTRYSAPEGMHDDCVCALALAVHHLRGPRPLIEFATGPL